MFSPDELGLEESARYVEAERRYQHIASERAAAADGPGAGWALLSVAWAMEKQGRGREALAQAEAARAVLHQAGDLKTLAECCHSLGVWRLPNLEEAPPVEDFAQAVEARLAIGDLMAAAQSWHNLGYVQLMTGRQAD